MEIFVLLWASGLLLAGLAAAVFFAGGVLLFAGKIRPRGCAAAWLLCAALLVGGVWQANGFFGLGVGVPRDFSAENWAETDPDDRHFMVDDLLANHPLTGLTAGEVRALLGAPDWADSGVLLSYVIGTSWLDPITLDVTLEGGVVTAVSENDSH